MKTLFASVFVAFAAVSSNDAGGHCMFRVHTEANPHDTAIFATSVRALFSGQPVSIEKIPRLSERDVVAFYLYHTENGNYGVLLKLGQHGRLALDTLSS
jgi:hypothetical protein